VYRIPGSGRAAGQALGESARELVRRHHQRVVRRLAGRGMSADEARAATQTFRETTRAAVPDLAAEVDGVGEGAGMTAADGWLLQLRSELLLLAAIEKAECSSLAITERTVTGGVLAGQNVDLPPDYAELFIILQREEDDVPALATVTPAGQLGHHGINEAGVAVFANYIHGARCQPGLPRYLLTRMALSCTNRKDAVARIEAVPRAKPRNLLVADDGGAVSAETTPEAIELFEPEGGLLYHTNHYLSPRLHGYETDDRAALRNSRMRLVRLGALLADTGFRRSAAGIMAVLADRADAPDAICHLATDTPELDVATVMTTIADVRARALWLSPGGPDGGRLQRFDFANGLRHAEPVELGAAP
jgi:predicted choloylglycine hydrolase